jgi:hypothetical protein
MSQRSSILCAPQPYCSLALVLAECEAEAEAMRAWNRIKKADRRLVQLVAVMLFHSAEIQKRHS